MTTISKEEVAALYAPFPLDKHSIREGHKSRDGKQIQWFVYLDRMAIQRRLDELFPGEWEAVYLDKSTDGDVSTVYMGIAIRGLRRDYNGTGVPNRRKDSEEEGVDENSPKGAMTDAFRRASSLWGLGAYMWETPQIWTDTYTNRKEKEEIEADAMRQFEKWYQRQFGKQSAAAHTPSEPPAMPKGTPPRRANPHDAAMAERPTEITVEVGSFACHQKKDGSGVFYVLTATPGEMDYDRVGDRKIYAFSRHAFAGSFYSDKEMAGWDESGASIQLPEPIPVQIKLDQHDTGTQFWKVAGE